MIQNYQNPTGGGSGDLDLTNYFRGKRVWYDTDGLYTNVPTYEEFKQLCLKQGLSGISDVKRFIVKGNVTVQEGEEIIIEEAPFIRAVNVLSIESGGYGYESIQRLCIVNNDKIKDISNAPGFPVEWL